MIGKGNETRMRGWLASARPVWYPRGSFRSERGTS